LAADRLWVPKSMIRFGVSEPLGCCLLRHRSPPLREYCLLNDVNRSKEAVPGDLHDGYGNKIPLARPVGVQLYKKDWVSRQPVAA
jgi:hypothetical protein